MIENTFLSQTYIKFNYFFRYSSVSYNLTTVKNNELSSCFSFHLKAFPSCWRKRKYSSNIYPTEDNLVQKKTVARPSLNTTSLLRRVLLIWPNSRKCPTTLIPQRSKSNPGRARQRGTTSMDRWTTNSPMYWRRGHYWQRSNNFPTPPHPRSTSGMMMFGHRAATINDKRGPPSRAQQIEKFFFPGGTLCLRGNRRGWRGTPGRGPFTARKRVCFWACLS